MGRFRPRARRLWVRVLLRSPGGVRQFRPRAREALGPYAALSGPGAEQGSKTAVQVGHPVRAGGAACTCAKGVSGQALCTPQRDHPGGNPALRSPPRQPRIAQRAAA